LVLLLYGIYHGCVYSEKLLMMDRGTVRNMYSFIPKNKFEKLVHLVGFIIRIYHDARSAERQTGRYRVLERRAAGTSTVQRALDFFTHTVLIYAFPKYSNF